MPMILKLINSHSMNYSISCYIDSYLDTLLYRCIYPYFKQISIYLLIKLKVHEKITISVNGAACHWDQCNGTKNYYR